jgi:threonine synthase
MTGTREFVMRYVSTRGSAPELAFDDVLLTGLAQDGGLYVPQSWPEFSAAELRELASLDYSEVALRVIRPFVGDALPEAELSRMVRETYRVFDHPAVAPLTQMGPGLWLMELFHGPTLAFKDFALQLVGRLFDHVLAARGERVTIVGATSGDTGSAAIEACRGRERIEIFILHPRGRVSEVQRRQMTTACEANVHNIAVEGTFDDCQDLVKALFNDGAFRDEMKLSAVNSINWARIMAQIAYYVAGAVALGAPERHIGFAVPTGNFGNVFAGYAARRMGLPIDHLVVGSNENDILTRFLESGTMAVGEVHATYSPSMDIQVSSNFERLLFDLLDRDGAAVARTMTAFRAEGRFDLDAAVMDQLRAIVSGFRLDDPGTLEEVRRTYEETGELLDPHSAIGLAAARACRQEELATVIALATAHPAKFPDAVEKATGRRPELPARLADLFEREERCSSLPNDLTQLQQEILNRVRANVPRGAA